jgi:hypothetical protein
MAQGVDRRALLAGGGAWSGGEQRVRSVGANARLGDWGFGISDWGGDRVCHVEASITVVAWANRDFARRAVDVVGWEGKICWGVT